ncbi:bifunctional biotin--[acetyl-CoA-carboxylase] ligase/biotin operon repressor BirA [Gilvimarinus xylanilyticus]|uniref:Bifunctional ligase/repressor BirA n=1 Tax=Gilvimarinus xylanilyticus TaxID=2944139 RepID=A0A9X2KVE9_9GAMM|nr:bifunctional biotin--[acetyl-CoA-carboxylase] ligase/biotin operon repressor BirA [Gilvimarinus xylanilyticus]
MSDSVLMQLLAVLADGKYHSGQELGERLSISRAAVWKQLNKLPELGVTLEKSRGQGYCLPGGLEVLDESSIRRAAPTWGAPLIIEQVIPSTNALLLAGAAEFKSGTVCLAERQSGGRGRRGRVWQSPFGSNLYLSMLWQYEDGASVLEGLSLAVGVCIAEALEGLGFSGIALKWPNDLLADGRKLAGVLLEMTGDPSGLCQVVVGVGINLQMPAAVAKDIDQPWVDLATLAREQRLPRVSRNELAGRLIARLAQMLQEFNREGFSSWRSRWQDRAAYIGQQVDLQTVSRVQSGRFVGVEASGALMLETDAGVKSFYGGEVSLRLSS